MVIGGTILPNARARWRILKQTRHRARPLAEQMDVNQINSADNEAGGLY